MRTRSGVPPRRGVLAAWAAETEREDQEAEAKALGLTRQKFDALQLGARPNAGIGRADSAFLRSPVPPRSCRCAAAASIHWASAAYVTLCTTPLVSAHTSTNGRVGAERAAERSEAGSVDGLKAVRRIESVKCFRRRAPRTARQPHGSRLKSPANSLQSLRQLPWYGSMAYCGITAVRYLDRAQFGKRFEREHLKGQTHWPLDL